MLHFIEPRLVVPACSFRKRLMRSARPGKKLISWKRLRDRKDSGVRDRAPTMPASQLTKQYPVPGMLSMWTACPGSRSILLLSLWT